MLVFLMLFPLRLWLSDISNNVLLQWGYTSHPTSGWKQVTFPATFSNVNYKVSTQIMDSGGAFSTISSTKTVTGISISARANGDWYSFNVDWIIIGY